MQNCHLSERLAMLDEVTELLDAEALVHPVVRLDGDKTLASASETIRELHATRFRVTPPDSYPISYPISIRFASDLLLSIS